MKNAFRAVVNALREKGYNSEEILDELTILFEQISLMESPNFLEILENKSKAGENDKKFGKVEAYFRDELNLGWESVSYEYLIYTIKHYRPGMTLKRDIYPKIAKKYLIDETTIPSSICFAIKKICERNPKLYEIMDVENKDKPIKTSKFISFMAGYLR